MKKWGNRRRRGGRPFSTPPHGSSQCSRKKRNRAANLFFLLSLRWGERMCGMGGKRGNTSPPLELGGKGGEGVQAARHQRFALSFFSSGRSCAKRSKKGGDFQEPPKQDIGGEGGGRAIDYRRNSIRRKNTTQKTFFIQSTFEGRSNFVLPHKHAPLEVSRNNFLCCCSSKRRRKEINSSPEGKRGEETGL